MLLEECLTIKKHPDYMYAIKSKHGSFECSMLLERVFNDKETPGLYVCDQKQYYIMEVVTVLCHTKETSC